MTTAENTQTLEEPSEGGVPDWAKLVISGGIIAALVSGLLAGAVALLAPRFARSWQTHDKRIEVRTLLATEMSKSFTTALTTARRLGTGLVYSPNNKPESNKYVIQTEYNRGFGEWEINSSRVSAELSARFPKTAQVGNYWRSYANAVEDYFRIAAVIPSRVRQDVLRDIKANLQYLKPLGGRSAAREGINWRAFYAQDKFAKRTRFRTSYLLLYDRLLAIGDQLNRYVLSLRPTV